MTRKKELVFLLLSDFIAINSAWLLFYWIRVESGWFQLVKTNSEIAVSLLLWTSLAMYGFWLAGFLFFGLYRQWYVRPILDEIITIVKTLGLGTLIFMIFVLWGPSISGESAALNDPRIIGIIYFVLLSVLTITLRLVVRFSQQRLLEAGYGRRTSIVLGDKAHAESLADKIAHYPRLGYDVIGYVSPNGEQAPPHSPIKRLGELKDIESIIESHKVREVLITLGSEQHDALLDVIGRTAGSNVGLKIVPDLYDIISGQARTREIYGFPLIDINPELQRPWEEATKRALDITVSFCILLAGVPVWVLTALAVRLTSKGPVIYKQERVGRQGEPFHIYKFRSMRTDAEAEGIPQWAAKNDPRVTPIGKFLRKSHLDEAPQLWNVLFGDMSLVGPRPERQFFVEKLSREIPYYTRRLRVRPGITGLYQAMVDKYDENIDDVRDRVRYDLMYIESMSFRLDLKILLRTLYTVIRGRGQA